MSERPYARYTRAKTWTALYSQHINACYAWVPFSITSNSIDVIACDSPEEAQRLMRKLERHADECKAYYASRKSVDQAPAVLAAAIQAKKLLSAVVLACSHDYYYYQLDTYSGLGLIACGLHNSYVPLPVWEMSTNRRYQPRETTVALTSPDFERIRGTPLGHNILLAAFAQGDPDAMAIVERLPLRTRDRLKHEKDQLQGTRYRGRPLAFLNEAERRALGEKISEGLKRYHAKKRSEGQEEKTQ